jgi:hypothetical protein
MFGAFDTDSLHFETRCLIRRVRELTGENERDAVHQALADRYQRLGDPASRHYLPFRVIVELPPDLERSFPNAGAVNDALRELLRRRGVWRESSRQQFLRDESRHDAADSATSRHWSSPFVRESAVGPRASASQGPSGVPEISRFHGIVIQMFAEPDARHHRPHFHAVYQETAASFAIDTLEILGGDLPIPQRRLVEAWGELHRDELLADWDLLRSGKPPVKIEPLA